MLWVRGAARRRAAVVSGTAAVLAVALVGCEGGASADGKAGATKSAGAEAGLVKAGGAAHPPAMQLVDDAESTEGGKAVGVDALVNDTFTKSGAQAAPLLDVVQRPDYVLTLDTEPRHGKATLAGNRFTYTPAAGYVGEDEFTYKVVVKGKAAGATPMDGTAVVRITMNTAAPAATPTTPAPDPVKTKKPAVPKKVYFENCSAVRAAGAAPIRTGQPGYGAHLDRDGDGVGCESRSASASSGGGSASSGGGSSSSGGGSTSGGTSSSTSGGGGSVSYKNCSAVRAAGAAPIRTGDPGYGRHLDRDGDGVGCE